MTLPNMPASVSWDRVAAFLDDLGIPVAEVSRDGVEIGWGAIKCSVYALDAEGHRFLDDLTGDAATHRIAIRVDHEPAPRTILLAATKDDADAYLRAHLQVSPQLSNACIVTPRSAHAGGGRGLTADRIIETPAFKMHPAAEQVRTAVAPCVMGRRP